MAGEIPSQRVLGGDDWIAIRDLNPAAPVHVLVIPKVHVATLEECDDSHRDILGRMFSVMGRIAREQGATDGFRAIINSGRGGRQEGHHLHAHILGGPERLPRMLSRD